MQQTVYDAHGNSFTLDSVDAREYLATGRFFTDVPKQQEAEKPKRASKQSKQETEFTEE
jgi:hypothetical protein